MNFAIISPTVGLRKFSTLSTTHLVLAHVQDKEYLHFYKERREAGDTLILDNGAHEQGESISSEQLKYAIHYYQPQIVVLPDMINDPMKTASMSLRFLDRHADQFPGVEWMYVVQAERSAMYLHIVEQVVNDSRVGQLIKWIGVTRYLSIEPNALSRPLVKKHMLEQLGKHKFHALGMLKGDLNELAELAEWGFDSCDSSVPVWRGWNGYSVGQENWPEIPVDFSTLEHALDDNLIYSNIGRCLETANADTRELYRRISRDGSGDRR